MDLHGVRRLPVVRADGRLAGIVSRRDLIKVFVRSDDEIGRRPTVGDLDYHMTTLFPPVRPKGHLEVRYIDAQPGDMWQVPVAAIEALLSTPAVTEEATAVAAPVREMWREAAQVGLGSVEFRAAAAGLLSLAAEASRDMRFTTALDAAAARCLRGRGPEVTGR